MHDGSEPAHRNLINQQPAPTTASFTSPSPRARRTTGDHLILWAACLAFAASTSVAAIISYKHAYRIAVQYGEAGIDAQTLPLTVDGLVATCSLVILYRTRKRRRPPWHAWALLVVAVIATVCANVANGLAHGPVGAIVAGWPALVAVGCFELLMRLLRDNREDHDTLSEQQPAAEHDQPPAVTAHETPTQEEQEFVVPDLTAEIVGAALRYAAELAEGTVPSIRQLKRELHVGHSKAARINHALASRIDYPATGQSTESDDALPSAA